MVTLRERFDGLQAIVNTADAARLINEPDNVALRYSSHAVGYRPSPRIGRWAERIASELGSGHPVTGYVVGDFGYGKTSAALHLARRCEASGIVAVPPATYDRVEQMAEAMHAWVRRAIMARVPSLAVELDAAKGGLPDRISTIQLVQYAQACTQLVLRAGYAGLLLVIDELQHYINFDEAGRVRIQGLSRMVQGVRDLAPVEAAGRAPVPGTPFGLVMLMPASPTEGMLREQASDMLQRMEERETSLRLDDAYGEAFVREVWAQVCDGLADPEEGRRCVHDTTFVALGQLVARRDLSSGPRTMMQALKQVVAHAERDGRPYTALDLARDYEAGHLVFDGPSHRIQGAMSGLLRRPEVQDHPRFRRAALMLAVLPEGVTEAGADEIDAIEPGAGESTFQAILDLNDAPHQWLGLVTYQPRAGAYALVSLQADARPQDVLTTLVRDFSARYLNHDRATRAKHALDGFVRHVVPHLLELRRQGTDTGFSYRVDGASEWAEDSRGVTYRILQGAPGQAFKSFPDRRLCVAVGTNPDDVGAFRSPNGTAPHMAWRVTIVPASALDVGAAAPLSITTSRADNVVDLKVPLGRTFGQSLPRDLDLLNNRVAPERANAQMLLALISHAARALEGSRAMSEADKQEHEQLVRNLTREVANLLIPDVSDLRLVQVRGISLGTGGLAGAGKALVESLFVTKCRELFPEYRPLAGFGQWKSNLSKYVAGLNQCSLAQRRGLEPVSRDRKSELARLFALQSVTYDNLRTYCKERVLFGQDTRDTSASGGGRDPSSTLVFTESHCEKRVLAVLEQGGRLVVPSGGGGQRRPLRTLEVSAIRDEVGKAGYLPDEVDEAVTLLVARQRVRRVADGTVQQHPGDLTAADLRVRLDAFEGRVRNLGGVLPGRIDALLGAIGATRQRLVGEPDEIALDRAEHELHDSTTALDEAVREARRKQLDRLRDTRRTIVEARAGLRIDQVEREIMGAVTIVGAINETRRRLAGIVKACDREIGEVDARIGSLLALAPSTDTSARDLVAGAVEADGAFEELRQRARWLGGLVETLPHWRTMVGDVGALVPEPSTPEWTEFDRVICAPILAHLSGREPDRLANYEHFKALVEERKREDERRVNERRTTFEREREAYHACIRRFVPEYQLRTPFDPAGADRSYAALRAEVVEKVRPAIDAQVADAVILRDDLLFLQAEKGIDVHEVVQGLGGAIQMLRTAEGNLATAATSIAELGRVVEASLHARDEVIGPARTGYEKRRMHVEPPDATEELVLGAFRAARQPRSTEPVSIERVRRDSPAPQPLEDLLDVVAKLYRKGHVEILVRLRQGA